jgi:hypothetical protein
VRFDVVVTSEIESLAHRVNVSLSKKRANIRLKAGQFSHRASQFGAVSIYEPQYLNYLYLAFSLPLSLNASGTSLQAPFLPAGARAGPPDASAGVGLLIIF